MPAGVRVTCHSKQFECKKKKSGDVLVTSLVGVSIQMCAGQISLSSGL